MDYEEPATTIPGMETTRDIVLEQLERHKGQFASGGELADGLALSRNAVWKAVEALRKDGWPIESVRGRGYRLDAESSILSAASIRRWLDDAGDLGDSIRVVYHDSIDSTNLEAKRLAESGACEGTLVVAGRQTAGRGRQGRGFFSPAGTGVYFTLLLRPTFEVGDVTLVTSAAAVAVAETIEDVFGKAAQIKWVNDVFTDGRKVSGILTEATFDAESARLAYAVLGIGVNVYTPEEGWPEEVAGVAHAISAGHADSEDRRARLVAGVASRFMRAYPHLPEKPHLEAYRARSLLDGREVEVFEGGGSYRALVLGVTDDFALSVRMGDGTVRELASGEVHIPSSQL